MNSQQADELHWFKSTYSGGDGGECVEVAADATAIHVRDSKEHGGPRLAFRQAAWAEFVADLGRHRY